MPLYMDIPWDVTDALGGICPSGTVHDLVSGRLEDLRLQDPGVLERKHFPRPVRVHRATLSRPPA